MKLGVTVCLDEVAGDEFYALLLIEAERARLEAEATRTGRRPKVDPIVKTIFCSQ